MLSYHAAHELTAKVKFGVEIAVVAPVIFAGLVFFVLFNDPEAARATFTAIAATSPIWLPFFLLKYFWITWMHYIRFKFWFAQEMVLLEVQLPGEVTKNPKAMELFITALYNSGGEVTFIKRLWEGSFRPIWSLEISSNEGQVNFYVHMRKAFRSVVEARLYGQFPEAQVREVEDYTKKVPFNIDEYDMWGCEYRKDPSKPQALPIKTYIDYGLDKDPDEEFKVDPISSTLELLASVGKGEYLWFQIVMKARKKDEWYGFYDTKHDSYKDGFQAGLKKIMAGAALRAGSLVVDEQAKAQAAARGLTLLTPGEKLKVEAMERSLEKLLFECGLRAIYFAKKESFRGTVIPNLPRFFDAFNSNEYNSITPTRWMAGLDYPWQDFHNIRRNAFKKKLFFLFQNRAYFYVPMDQVPVFLTVEELATVWHFPSSGVRTPGLNRVASKRSEAPPDLPELPT
jgi:hypothetical protein